MQSGGIERLLNDAGTQLADGELSLGTHAAAGKLGEELRRLLTSRNGFYAYGGALHVLGTHSVGREPGIDLWNSEALWRGTYGDLAAGCLFFAEDALADQYCVHEDRVFRFDHESGDKEPFAASLDQWAELIARDPSQTGVRLLRDWEAAHGHLKEGFRLFARYPFVAGGEFAIQNLRAMDSVAGLRFYGEIARQIHKLPDGTPIKFRITE